MSRIDPKNLNDQASNLSSQDVHVFNEHLRCIAQSGIPMDLGSVDGLPMDATRITSLGSSVIRRIQNEPEHDSRDLLTSCETQYEQSLRMWGRNKSAFGSLNPLVLLGQARRAVFHSIASSFTEPLLLLVLAYLGTLYLQATLVPRFEAMYRQLGIKPEPILSFLQAMRDSTFVWSTIVILIAGFFLLFWRITKTFLSMRWIPKSVHQLDLVHKSNRAGAIAHAVENAQPLPALANDSRSASPVTPLMRWALDSGTSAREKADALRFVQSLYLEFPEYSRIRWRYWLPIGLSTLIGGAIALAFGLSVFGPVIEMLYVLVRPESGL